MKNSLFILIMVCLFLTSMIFTSCEANNFYDETPSKNLNIYQDDTSIDKDEIQTAADKK